MSRVASSIATTFYYCRSNLALITSLIIDSAPSLISRSAINASGSHPASGVHLDCCRFGFS